MVPAGFFGPQYFAIIGVFRRYEKGVLASLQIGKRPDRGLRKPAETLSCLVTEFPQIKQAQRNP
jgi:hypothetical protein